MSEVNNHVLAFSKYIASDDYQDRVLVKMIEAWPADFKKFLLTCNQDELETVGNAIENAVLDLDDYSLLDSFKARAQSFPLIKNEMNRWVDYIGKMFKLPKEFRLYKLIIDQWDPLSLLEINGAPLDEYDSESQEAYRRISVLMNPSLEDIENVLIDIFSHSFNEAFSAEETKDAAQKIKDCFNK